MLVIIINYSIRLRFTLLVLIEIFLQLMGSRRYRALGEMETITRNSSSLFRSYFQYCKERVYREQTILNCTPFYTHTNFNKMRNAPL